MAFSPGVSPPRGHVGPSWWFVFRGSRLLVETTGDRERLPYLGHPSELGLQPIRTQYLGQLDGSACFSAEVPNGTRPPGGSAFLGLRPLMGVLHEDIASLACRAIQIMKWDQRHQYCGRCGTLTRGADEERVKICPRCGLKHYPRISPAVIVAVIRDRRILLARATRFKNGMYSVLAGFVEPGETLEECLRREVREEVGIEIRDIRYFGSQSWPFPDSLMIGFTARHGGGEIRVDGKEIQYADWFRAETLPVIPEKISIARALIDWFIEAET